MPHNELAFEGFVEVPERETAKPRTKGRTMIIDWGLDAQRVEGQLDVIAAYVDAVKIPIGLPRLYSVDALKSKFAIYRSREISSYLGGGFIEHLIRSQGFSALVPFLEEAKSLGFDIVEISDNYVPLDRSTRQAQIRAAIGIGFTVYGEVGSKHERTDPKALASQAYDCLEAGAEMVVLEGAEFVSDGAVQRDTIERLAKDLDLSRVMWEVPGPWVSGVSWWMVQDLLKMLISMFGSDVSIGNVMPDDALHTEALRVNLGVVQPTEKPRS